MSSTLDTLLRWAAKTDSGLIVLWLFVAALVVYGIDWLIGRIFRRNRQRLEQTYAHEDRLTERMRRLEERTAKLEDQNDQLRLNEKHLAKQARLTRGVLEHLIDKINEDERISWDPEEADGYSKLDSDPDYTPTEGKDAV